MSWVRQQGTSSICVDSLTFRELLDLSLCHTAHEPELRLPYVRSRFKRASLLRPSFLISLTFISLLAVQTFDILDAFTWRADVNSFAALDSQITFGPTYALEYSTREVYGANITGWGPDDPLNATWWHLVTECTFPSLLHLKFLTESNRRQRWRQTRLSFR